MAPQGLFDEFFRYIQNDIPPRFVLTSEMKIVDRSEVQKYFQPLIEDISEQDINQSWDQFESTREEGIKRVVKRIVGYGIFSHRWFPEGEPTLKEMVPSSL